MATLLMATLLTATWQRPVPDPAISGAVPVPSHIARRAGTRAFPETAPDHARKCLARPAGPVRTA